MVGARGRGAALGGRYRARATIAGVPVYSRSAAAHESGKRADWLLKMPAGWSDGKLGSFAKGVPPSCEVRFWGHPSDGGLPVIALRASAVAVNEFLGQSESSSIEYVEADEDVFALEPGMRRASARALSVRAGPEASGRLQPSPPSWGLDRIDQHDLPLSDSYSWQGSGGGDVHVYVLDTGIRTTHADFGGRAIPTLDATEGPLEECAPGDVFCANDTDGHGTHCAGTIGGTSYGVAKHAVLHSVKIISDAGYSSGAIFLRALDWVITNGQRPAVISASIRNYRPRFVIEDGVDSAVRAGITVVVAAGNENIDACEQSPAFVPSAITVAASDERDVHSFWGSATSSQWARSNFGPCVDIYAPGTNIVSASSASDTDEEVFNGTSMACPHVAGAAALLLGRDPALAPADVARLLLAQATGGKVANATDATPNALLYTLSPASRECCYWGSSCQDPLRACNEPSEWCSQSRDRCLDHCGGKLFCSSNQTAD